MGKILPVVLKECILEKEHRKMNAVKGPFHMLQRGHSRENHVLANWTCSWDFLKLRFLHVEEWIVDMLILGIVCFFVWGLPKTLGTKWVNRCK